MKRSTVAQVLVCVLSCTAFSAPAARAQGTGRSMDIDLSVRSAAMGGASNAVFRGGELNHWGNPALLGYAKDIRYEWSRTPLVPGLATDVWITGKFTKVGIGGLGLVFGGKPAGPEGLFLHYGGSQGTDESGNPTGTFSSYERAESWGFGVSLLESFESLRRVAGASAPGWSRYVDASFGMTFKEAEISIGLGSPALASGIHSRDIGALLRVTPFDAKLSGVPVRVDASYGWSVLNQNDTRVVFISEDQASPLTRHRRHGLALGVEAGSAFEGIEDRRLRALARGLQPLVSLSVASDWASLGGGDAVDFKTSGTGFEIVIAQVFAFRHGSYVDRTGDIDGSTRGWAVSLPIGRFAGFTHEQAWVPQARNSDLEDVHRKAYAVWLDPIEIIGALRHSSEAAAARAE